MQLDFSGEQNRVARTSQKGKYEAPQEMLGIALAADPEKKQKPTRRKKRRLLLVAFIHF